MGSFCTSALHIFSLQFVSLLTLLTSFGFIVNLTMAPRYSCPPWFECAYPWPGKPMCLRTMRTHRNTANQRRRSLHRGTFRWGPRVPEGAERYIFRQVETLAEHDSEDDLDSKCLTGGGSFQTTPQVDDQDMVHGDTVAPGGNIFLTEKFQERVEADGGLVQGGLEFEDGDLGGNGGVGDGVFTSSGSELSEDVTVGFVPETLSNNSEGETSDDVTSSHGSSSQFSDPFSENESEDGYNGSRIPGLMEWIYANKKCLEYYQKHGTKISAMEDVLELFEAPCETWKTVISNVLGASRLSDIIEVYPMCLGHMAFVDLLEERNDGIHRDVCCCGSTADDVHDVFRSLPLLPRLRTIVKDEESCRKLYEYRWSREPDIGIVRDYYDGKGYAELCEQFRREDGLKYDVFVGLSTDGFQAYKNRRSDVWVISALNFNLPPHIRYKVKNFLPIVFVPGPQQPQDMQSFLIPVVNEIWKTHHEDVMMKFYDGVVRRVRIHVIYFSGDQQAICKCGGLVGYNGKSPCRSCKILGEYHVHY